MHEQVINLSIVILVACAGGLLCSFLRVPVIVGYIFGGCLVNSLVGDTFFDQNMIKVTAELGVILLLFVIGMELNLRDFYDVMYKGALITVFQIFAGLVVSYYIGFWLGWSQYLILVAGFCLAISSTMVVLSVLRQQDILDHRLGRLSVSVVLAQDLALAPMMMILNLQGLQDVNFMVSVIRLVLPFALMLIIIRYLFLRETVNLDFLHRACKHQEVVILVFLSIALIFSALSFSMGLSYAYGAFLAGLIIGNSTIARRVLQVINPIQHLTVLFFFFSIGLMLDLGLVMNNLKLISMLIILVLLGKFVLNFLLFWCLRENVKDAIQAGFLMSQLGEFSFILIGFSSNIYGRDDAQLQFITILIAGSLFFSPIMYAIQQNVMALFIKKR